MPSWNVLNLARDFSDARKLKTPRVRVYNGGLRRYQYASGLIGRTHLQTNSGSLATCKRPTFVCSVSVASAVMSGE